MGVKIINKVNFGDYNSKNSDQIWNPRLKEYDYGKFSNFFIKIESFLIQVMCKSKTVPPEWTTDADV